MILCRKKTLYYGRNILITKALKSHENIRGEKNRFHILIRNPFILLTDL